MIEAEARRIVRERSEGICEIVVPGICLKRAAGVHHRLKRSHGGAWAPSNLLDACGSGTTGCHGYTEAHPAWARDEGLWLMTGDGDPRDVSVHMRWMNAKSWWLLDDEGILEHDLGGDFELCMYSLVGGASGAPSRGPAWSR